MSPPVTLTTAASALIVALGSVEYDVTRQILSCKRSVSGKILSSHRGLPAGSHGARSRSALGQRARLQQGLCDAIVFRDRLAGVHAGHICLHPPMARSSTAMMIKAYCSKCTLLSNTCTRSSGSQAKSGVVTKKSAGNWQVQRASAARFELVAPFCHQMCK